MPCSHARHPQHLPGRVFPPHASLAFLCSFSIPPLSRSATKSRDSTPNTPFRPLKILLRYGFAPRTTARENILLRVLFPVDFLPRGVPPPQSVCHAAD